MRSAIGTIKIKITTVALTARLISLMPQNSEQVPVNVPNGTRLNIKKSTQHHRATLLPGRAPFFFRSLSAESRKSWERKNPRAVAIIEGTATKIKLIPTSGGRITNKGRAVKQPATIPK